MLADLGYEISPLIAALIGGGVLGVLFGFLAQRSRFCLRRGLVGAEDERSSALGLWLTALGVAVLGTQALVMGGYIDFSEHRFASSSIALPAIVLGGLLFGTGMVLARGCASRLTVLTATGNLRALVAVLVFAVIAHATLKGFLAPARVWLSSVTVDLGGFAQLSGLPGGALLWTGAFLAGLAVFVWRLQISVRDLLFGALIGALVPAGWFVTGVVLFDDFDPIPFESLAFTSSASETLFWTIAGTAVAPGFGVGLFGGVLVGSLIASILWSEFRWQGFETDTPAPRYLIGGALMGVGGVLAGGCTVGAGLSGMSTLSVAAMIALGAIVFGALLSGLVLKGTSPAGSLVPAE